MNDFSNVEIEKIKEYYSSINEKLIPGEKINLSNKNSEFNIQNFVLNENIFEFDDPIDNKPSNGYWTSHGMNQYKGNRGWIDWNLIANIEWILPSEKDIYAVKLINNDQKIYKLDNKDKIEKFTNKYGYEDKINWKQVKDDGYYGVDVSPFTRKNLEPGILNWYIFFDCSSQCIWDYRGIEYVRKLT